MSGREGRTPMWVFDALRDRPNSSRSWPMAAALYARLDGEWADGRTGRCFPSTKTIAKSMGWTETTVKRCLDDLEAVGALTSVARFEPSGRQTTNLITLQRKATVDGEHGRGTSNDPLPEEAPSDRVEGYAEQPPRGVCETAPPGGTPDVPPGTLLVEPTQEEPPLPRLLPRPERAVTHDEGGGEIVLSELRSDEELVTAAVEFAFTKQKDPVGPGWWDYRRKGAREMLASMSPEQRASMTPTDLFLRLAGVSEKALDLMERAHLRLAETRAKRVQTNPYADVYAEPPTDVIEATATNAAPDEQMAGRTEVRRRDAVVTDETPPMPVLRDCVGCGLSQMSKCLLRDPDSRCVFAEAAPLTGHHGEQIERHRVDDEAAGGER